MEVFAGIERGIAGNVSIAHRVTLGGEWSGAVPWFRGSEPEIPRGVLTGVAGHVLDEDVHCLLGVRAHGADAGDGV